MKSGYIAIFLALSLFTNSLRVNITYAYYYLDPISFIEKLCENKDKPELQCNGKCQLAKLAQDTNNSESSPIKIPQQKEISPYIFLSSTVYSFINNTFIIKTIYSYINLYSYVLTKKAYHPPRFN